MSDFFPTKLALGEQFCNRVEERRKLQDNIMKARHSVLVSPRRYGKTSLTYKVLNEIHLPYAFVDLFLAHNDKTVVQRLLVGISQLISQVIPAKQKVLERVQNIFAKFRVTFSVAGFAIEMNYETVGSDYVEQVYSALTALTKLLSAEKKKAVFFIDEFQDIAAASSAKSLQGAIRHIAQETSDVVFIFSGSNRHLLLELFDDRSKPLYMLCDKIFLDRMTSTDYKIHIQKLAKRRWRKSLDEMTFNRIVSVTELHPFYVNMLCHQLWQQDTLPDLNDVDVAWDYCYDSEERRIVAELGQLTSNQQDLLKALAIEPTREPTGQKFIARTAMASSTIRRIITALFEKDMLYKVKQRDEAISSWQVNQLRVLDPLIAFALRKYS